MGTLFNDLRYGLRMLLKSPGFTLAAVASLALGIGANTAVFSVVNSVLLKALPYQEPESIVLAWGDDPKNDNHRGQVSFTDVEDWRQQNNTFEEISTYTDWRPILSGVGGDPERIPAMQISDGYFKVMKGQPLLGRVFTPEEQQEGKDFVIVLGHGLWQRRFGGDARIIGQKVMLNSRPYTVVGVMPADFQSLPAGLLDAPAQMYRPVAETHDEKERASRHLRAIARLKPGISLEQAQVEMSTIAGRLAEQHPAENTGYGVRLVSLREDLVGSLRPAILMLFGAVVFVLLIACANVGNLLLARSSARQKEIAIRAALGAGRSRLVRQFLTESVLLSLIGGALGLLLALWGTSLIEALSSRMLPVLGHVEIDVRVLGFTVLISIMTAVVFGLAPALQASRPDLNESLKESGRGSSGGPGRNRLRGALVVSEIALSLVLLICAGLLIKSVMRLRDVNPGFNPDNLLTMNVWLPSAKYPKAPAWLAFYDQMLQRIESVPGVKAAGVVSVLPLSTNFDGRTLEVEGQPKAPGESPEVELYIATPDYLRAMEIPTLKGRALSAQDGANAPRVALVSETMARRFWPNEDPLGKRVRFLNSDPEEKRPWASVVGVVSDVKQKGLDAAGTMQFYLPLAQQPSSAMTLVIRTSTADPSTMIAPVRREIIALDQDQAAFNIATMDQLRAESTALRRFSMSLLALFAVVALTLAAVGIYGVIAYSVTQRTHEIGIRIALGAERRDVLKLVVGQGLKLALLGVGLGLAAAFALTRVLSSLLYGVSATDPAIFTGLSLLLASVAVLACLIPARRATKVDPIIALRYE